MGATLDPSQVNIDETWGRKPDAFGPDPVGSHPASRSPFGVDDLAGNVWEITRQGEQKYGIRGGGWYETELSAMSANREPFEGSTRDAIVGARLCADAPSPP
jgi:formylglycine-generating enzyme required for sulfatase activity